MREARVNIEGGDQAGRDWAGAARDEVVDFAEKLAEAVREALIVLDPGLRVVFANPAFYEQFQVNADDTEGCLIYQLGDGQWDIPELRRLLEVVLPNDEQFKDHRVEHTFEGLGHRVMLLNGRRLDHVQFVVLAFEDVTERDAEMTRRRKNVEGALRESEERHRLMLESALDYAVFAIDAEGMITEWPPGAQAVLGGAPEEMVGRDVAVIFTPEDRAAGVPEGERAKARESGYASDVRWHLRNDGSRVFIDGAIRPLRHEAGDETGGFLKVGRDITEQRRVQQALRESEERFRQFADNSRDVLWIADAESGRLEYLSPAFQAVFGEPSDEVLADLRRWGELVHPEDRERAREGMPRLLNGEVFSQEYRVVRPAEGAVRWIRDTGFPIRDESGRVRRVAGIAQDVTDRRWAEEARRESEERFRQFADASTDVMWVRDAETMKMEYLNPAFETLYGRPPESILGKDEADWSTLIHPEDRSATLAAIERVRRGGRETHEFRITRPDGQVRWVENTDFPLRDAEGRVQRLAGFAKDVTERRRAGEHEKVLVAELQHRVRNILAIARSVARRSASGAETVEDYAMHLDGRINALARTQAVLTRAPGEGVGLEALIADELMAYAAGADQVRISGPEVRLQPKAAETLGLAIHELATNAVKYGALALAGGRIAVTWTVVPDGSAPLLKLDWRETGVAVDPAEPRRRGFGQELIERTVPYELGAKAELAFEPGGICCRIDMPMTARNVVAEGAVARGANLLRPYGAGEEGEHVAAGNS